MQNLKLLILEEINVKIAILLLTTTSFIYAGNFEYRKQCDFAQDYAQANPQVKPQDYEFSKAHALKSLVNYYVSKNKLHNNPDVTTIHEDKFALINNPQVREAIAIFEIPDGKTVYLLNEEEIKKYQEAYAIQEAETKGSHRMVKFQYEDENLLPRNENQVLYQLYFPNVLDGMRQEDLSPQEWKEYFDHARPIASTLNEALDTTSKMELVLGAAGKRIIVTAQLAKRILSNREGHKEGLIGTTAIKTEDGYRAIKDLKVGDRVACYDKINKKDVTSTITNVEQSQVSKYIQITLDNGTLEVAPEHKFYIERYDTWVTASELCYSPNLKDFFGSNIKEIKEIDQPLDIVNITVDSHHNFYITKNNILVHNMIPIAIEFGITWGPAGIEASWAFIAPVLATLGTYLLHKIFGKRNNESNFLILPYPADSVNKAPEAAIFKENHTIKTNKGKYDAKQSSGSSLEPEDKNKNNKRRKGTLPPPLGSKKNSDTKSGPNGKYEDASYHHKNSSGNKSPSPKDGQSALDNSVTINEDSSRRVGVSEGEYVVLTKTSEGQYHGHTRSWNDLRPEMQRALKKANLVKPSGKII